MSSPVLGVIVASTRPGRRGLAIGEWILARAKGRSEWEVELIDLLQAGLPIFDEPEIPRRREYQHAHTKAWAATIDRCAAFIMVTPEYNHLPPPALINALDFLYHEWGSKPAAFVGYGGAAGGARAVTVLRSLAQALRMVTLPDGVSVVLDAGRFDAAGSFLPKDADERATEIMLNGLALWTVTLQRLG